MKKLRLDVEEIAVETFSVTAMDGGAEGTVEGQQMVSGMPSCTMFCTILWGGVCGETPQCNVSAEYACPTASCHADCTVDCTISGGATCQHTCPATCDWGGGCFSGHINCPN